MTGYGRILFMCLYVMVNVEKVQSVCNTSHGAVMLTKLSLFCKRNIAQNLETYCKALYHFFVTCVFSFYNLHIIT